MVMNLVELVLAYSKTSYWDREGGRNFHYTYKVKSEKQVNIIMSGLIGSTLIKHLPFYCLTMPDTFTRRVKQAESHPNWTSGPHLR